jgi:hypothetical protein
MPIPCSRSAHDQNVLARRAQLDQHGCPSEGKKPNELGWNINIRSGRPIEQLS